MNYKQVSDFPKDARVTPIYEVCGNNHERGMEDVKIVVKTFDEVMVAASRLRGSGYQTITHKIVGYERV